MHHIDIPGGQSFEGQKFKFQMPKCFLSSNSMHKLIKAVRCEYESIRGPRTTGLKQRLLAIAKDN